MPIKKAIILAAGLGIRLGSISERIPKCLLEINGKPIIVNALELLEKKGIEEAVIVVGHLKNKIIEKIGSTLGNLRIKYIENPIYNKTNNMYSLWLAKDYLKQGAILIEGDCFFEEELLTKLLNSEKSSCWAKDQFTPKMDGCMSIVNEDYKIQELKIIRETLQEYKKTYFKSTGVLKISHEFGTVLSEWLEKEVELGNTNIYYDLVIAKYIQKYPLHVCNITGIKWIEIDNLDDLKKAEELFK